MSLRRALPRLGPFLCVLLSMGSLGARQDVPSKPQPEPAKPPVAEPKSVEPANAPGGSAPSKVSDPTSDAPAPKGGSAAEAAQKEKLEKEAAKDPAVAREVKEFNLGDEALAIDGYDPVAYFPEGGGKPAQGLESITYRYRGVVYRFKDEANKKRFVEDPRKYEPAYGGWCAYGCAKQDKVEIDPESYLIENGRLMLFYDGFLADTRSKWLSEGAAKLKPRADDYWAGVLSKKHE